MGTRPWEPASRYEFEARLFEDQWTIDEIAATFGRKRTDVQRDLKAHQLYRRFANYERKRDLTHRLTYNVFAEAARAPSIMKWLGWSDEKKDITNKQHEKAFFDYLFHHLAADPTMAQVRAEQDSDSDPPSDEEVVRNLREMLKLKDDKINEALLRGDFGEAERQFERSREGKFAARVKKVIASLANATQAELKEGAKENKRRLKELIEQATTTMLAIDAIMRRRP